MNLLICSTCGAKYNSNTVDSCPMCKNKVDQEVLNILNNKRRYRRTKREIEINTEHQELIDNKLYLHNLLIRIAERKNIIAKFNNKKHEINYLYAGDGILNSLYKQADNIAKKLSPAKHLTSDKK